VLENLDKFPHTPSTFHMFLFVVAPSLTTAEIRAFTVSNRTMQLINSFASVPPDAAPLVANEPSGCTCKRIKILLDF